MKDRTDRCRAYPRTRKAKEAFLRAHFRYGGSYAVRIRIRDIRHKTEIEESALWDAISAEWHPAWDQFEETRDEFIRIHKDSGISLEGRSNGYAVLRVVNSKGQYLESVPIDDDALCHFFKPDYLDEQVRLVRAFDKAVEYMIRDFIAEAVYHYKNVKRSEKA